MNFNIYEHDRRLWQFCLTPTEINQNSIGKIFWQQSESSTIESDRKKIPIIIELSILKSDWKTPISN